MICAICLSFCGQAFLLQNGTPRAEHGLLSDSGGVCEKIDPAAILPLAFPEAGAEASVPPSS